MGTVKGLSCHRNQYQVANTTDAEALQGIRINAAKLGADAVINTFCQTNSTIDWRNNCWASITCVGEAIRFIDDTSTNPSASPSQASQPWKRPEPKLSNNSRDGSASGQEPALLEAPQSGLKPDFVPAIILSVTRLGLKTDVPEGTTSITLECSLSS